MSVETSSTASPETWPQLFTALQFHLSPLDVVRLTTCSKATKDFWSELLTAGDRQLARALLMSALEGAASNSRVQAAAEPLLHGMPWQDKQHRNVVKWLMQRSDMPSELLKLDSQNYLSIPHLPVAVCKQLVAADVTVSYDQLVSAARNHVEGVENWVLADKLLAKHTGFGCLVEAVCCSEWRYSEGPLLAGLTPAALAALLHIAINAQHRSSGTGTYYAPIATLSTVLGCTRRTTAGRQLSAEQLLQLLQSQVHVLSSRKIDSRDTHYCMAEFSFLLNSAGGASSLSSNAVEQLLLTAVRQRLDPSNLQYLLTLQAIIQLDAAGIARVLQAELSVATAYGPGKLRDSVVDRLCRLPAADSISPEDCAGLCKELIGFIGRAAAPIGRSQWYAEVYSVLRGLISKLRRLQGMQEMSPSAVLQLLQITVEVCKGRKVQDSVPYSVVKLLCGLPAAAVITGSELHELLQQAEELGPAVCDVLWQLSEAW